MMRHTLTPFVAVFMAAIVILAGCTDKPTKPKSPKDDAHGHPDKGPHGGALAEWGDENYHAEFTVDHAKKQATVYILDGSAANAAPVAANSLTLRLTNVKPAVEITLKADPEAGDPKGQCSRFSGTHEK